MKKWIVILIVVGMVGWAVIDFIDFNEETAEPLETLEKPEEVEVDTAEHQSVMDESALIGLDVGNIAPDFELETIDGKMVMLSDFRGERVMVNFWATWCAPCRAEMPDLEKFHQNTDIVILGINLFNTEDSVENVERFTDEYGTTFPILMDVDSTVANLYQIKPIPTSYMVDSNGKISNMAFGALNYDLMLQGYELMD